MATASHADLAAAISAAAAAGGAGVLLLRGLAPGAAPLAAVRDLFDLVASRPELVERANAAYKRDKLIFKDTYATGKVREISPPTAQCCRMPGPRVLGCE